MLITPLRNTLFFCLLLCAGAPSVVMANSEEMLSKQLDNIANIPDWDTLQLEATKLSKKTQSNLAHYSQFLTQMGKVSLRREKLKAAESYFSLLAEKNKESQSNDDKFTAYKMLGITYYYQGQYDKSISSYQTALNIAKLRNQPLELANIHNNLGLALLKAHKLEGTVNHYIEAHRLYEVYGTEQDKADMLLNLSGVYIRQYRYEIAKDMLLRAVTLFEQLNDPYGIALANANLGVVYSYQGDTQLARESLLAAVSHYEEIDSVRHLTFEYSNLANISILMGEMARGYQEVQRALQYADKLDLDSGRMEALYPLSKLQIYRGENRLALKNIEKAISLARAQGSKLREMESMAVLAIAQASIGESSKAIETFIAYQKLQRESQNAQLVARLNEYQDKVEATELNQEIEKLRQQQAVQSLKLEQRTQFMWFIGLFFILFIIALFSVYRRRIERKANVDLSQQVAKRTAELQKIANELGEANKIKSQFLANISHEIRTPLTSILGNSDVLLHEYLHDPHLQSSLKVIQRQGEHLKELVSDVLDLSKIEAQRFELEFTEFTLSQLLDDVTEMFQHECEVKGLNFIVSNTLPTPYTVRLDYIRLKQVLINLLSNAIKFTERGHIELVASQEGNGVKFSINDTGIGMDAVQLKHIFDSFQQGDSSITRRFGGSGLGLCLSQQLTNMMGGNIQVNSEPNKGSQFYTIIPCARLEAVSESTNLVQDKTAQNQEQKSLTGSVLIVEDHEDNLKLFERVLRQLGVEVFTAENGKVAIEKALIEFPDLILMDIQMPVLDGLEAFKFLRQAGYDGPIFALTANVMQHEIQSYLSLGFEGHIGKPLDRDKLVCILEKYLNEGNRLDVANMQVDISDLIESFALSLEQERFAVIDLWQTQDWAGLKSFCHRLGGAASTFGFEDIANTAKHIEEALKNPQAVDTHGLQHWYLILCDEMQQVQLSEQLNVS